MNRIERVIVVLLIVISVLTTYIVATSFQRPSVVFVPQGYIYREVETVRSMDVWQDVETKVNETWATYELWFAVTYNVNEKKIEKNLLESRILSMNTSLVYHSFNTSEAINWAIQNGDCINLKAGNYTITQSIIIDSGTILNGSNFTCTEAPCFIVEPNASYVLISDCNFVDLGEKP